MTHDDDVRLPVKVHLCEACRNRRIPADWRYCERCQAIREAMGESPTDGFNS